MYLGVGAISIAIKFTLYNHSGVVSRNRSQSSEIEPNNRYLRAENPLGFYFDVSPVAVIQQL